MDEIFEDIKKRGCVIAGFIIQNEDTGLIRLITYDTKGCADFLTEEVERMDFYRRNDNNTISQLAQLSVRDD